MSRRSTFLLPLVLTCLVACVIEAKDEDKKGGGDGSGSDTGSGGDGTLDSDGDGISDADEAELGTDPNDSDSDDDGYPDGEESTDGTNPLDAYSHTYEGGYMTLASIRLIETGLGYSATSEDFVAACDRTDPAPSD